MRCTGQIARTKEETDIYILVSKTPKTKQLRGLVCDKEDNVTKIL
jgi:hypothetical protein